MKTPKIKKDKKPFRETKFGIWLKEHDSELFDFLAKRWPDKKPIGKFIKIVFTVLSKATAEDKVKGQELIDLD